MKGSNTLPHIAQQGVHFSRKVTCLETGKVYESISRFCSVTGASKYNINLSISKAEPFVHEGRSYVIEGHGVCLIPASTEGTVARPKYEIGSTVLVRLGADICRCKVSYRYHCGEGYIYRVERVANHGGIRRTVAIEIYEIDIIEQLKEAEEWNNKPYESMTTMSSEKMDCARENRMKLEEQRRHARW